MISTTSLDNTWPVLKSGQLNSLSVDCTRVRRDILILFKKYIGIIQNK